MEYLKDFADFFLQLDKHLGGIIQDFGMWSYLILFLIIFCETGLVVTPFLPGDSLLFATGAFAALGAFDPWILFVLLSIAGILGDTVNYAMGHYLGPKVFHYESSRFFNKEHLLRAHQFYEKYGAKTIVIARFIPIVRTFAPFVAGIGSMSYGKFLAYNVAGGMAWVGSFVMLGYYFGNRPTVKENFSLVILGIIVISIMPAVIEYLRHRRSRISVRPS